MKIFHISILTLLYFSLIQLSFAESPTTDIKSILELDNTDFAFGTVLEGEKVQATFQIANTGNAPLNIINFVPTCGCMITKLPSQVIDGGATMPISVEFDTRGFAGWQSQQVAINTDNLDHKQVILTMSGEVEPEVVIKPAKIFISNISAKDVGKLPKVEFKITVNPKSKANITDLLDLSELLEVKDLKISTKKASFSAHYVSPEKPGLYRDRLAVNLKGASRKNYNIPIFIKVQEPLEVIPPALSFGLIKPGSKTTKKLLIKFPKEMELRILEINSENPAVTAKVESNASSKDSISLIVAIDSAQVHESILTDLVLVTNQVTQPEIRVNVFATVPPKLDE